MKLRQIEIEGFRGIREKIIVPFGEDFTIVTGPNGAGKSSVIDAIEFSLSGRLAKFGDEKTEKSESGEKGSDYVWWRGMPLARTHFIETQFSQSADEVVRFRTTPDTAEKRPPADWFCEVDQAPQDPLERICQTSIFRDELIAILGTDMGELQRGDFVNKAIGLTELVAVERRCTEYLSALRKKANELQQSYDLLRGRVTDLTAEASEIRASVRAATQMPPVQQSIPSSLSIQELVSTTRSRLTRVRRESENLERLKARWSATSTQVAQVQLLRAGLSNLVDEQDRTAALVTNLESELRSVDAQLSSIRALDPIISSLAQIREHGGRIGLRQGHCPLCNSEIVPEKYEQHLAELDSEIDAAHRHVAEVTERQASLSAKLQAARAQAVRVQTERDRTDAEINSIENSVKQLRGELATSGVAANDEAIESRIKQTRLELALIERQFATAEASVSLERVTEIERTREGVENECSQVETRLQVLQRATNTAEKIATTVRRASRELLEERVAALNPLLSELYFRLRPHVDYTDVKYRMRGDVRRLLRLEVGNELNPRFMFSSGQRRALGLAFLLAVHLSRPWCRFQTLILDDAVQHVDDYRALHLVEVLSSIRQTGHQVICTVEDPALADLLCRRLRATGTGRGIKITMKYESGIGVTVGGLESIGPMPKSVLLSA